MCACADLKLSALLRRMPGLSLKTKVVQNHPAAEARLKEKAPRGAFFRKDEALAAS
jgi:hypothetical protein